MKPIEVPGDGDGHAHLTGVVAVAVGGVVAADRPRGNKKRPRGKGPHRPRLA